MSKKLILDHRQITQKIKRIAFEIYEQNFDAEELTIIGIRDQGFKLAGQIIQELEEISKIKINFYEVKMNKKKALEYAPDLSSISSDLKSKRLIFIDDVLNSGKTLLYSIRPFLDYQPEIIKVAVLINRDHRSYPVYPDFTGLSLATTIQDHVELNLNEEDNFSAYLK